MSIKNKNLEFSEIQEFIFSFSDSERKLSFLDLDLDKIAKLILNKYFLNEQIDVHCETTDADFKKIRENYIRFCWENALNTHFYAYIFYEKHDFDSFSESIPIEKTPFYEHICKTWVGIAKSPCDEMKRLERKVFEDRQQIEKNLEICENKKKEWEEKFSTNSGLRDAYQKLAGIYIDENKEAKKRISQFMSSRQKKIDRIKELVSDGDGFFSSFRLGLHQSISPYGFRYNESHERLYDCTYNLAYFSEGRHKFMHLSPHSQKYQYLCEGFYERPDDLDEKCLKYEEYIEKYKIVEAIQARLSHVRLQSRSQVISTCLNLYLNRDDLNSFIILAVTQIEGCFDDFCRKIIDPVNRLSLSDKVQSVYTANIIYDFEYRYFRCIFPGRIRNQVAHGELIAPELLRFTSASVLLDLNCATNILCRSMDEITWLGAELLGSKEPTPLQDIASICLLQNIESQLEDHMFREDWNLLLKEHQILLNVEEFLDNKIDYITRKSPYWTRFREQVSLAQKSEQFEKKEQNIKLAIQNLCISKLELIWMFLDQLENLKSKLTRSLPVFDQTIDSINFLRERLIDSREISKKDSSKRSILKDKSQKNVLACIKEWKKFFELE